MRTALVLAIVMVAGCNSDGASQPSEQAKKQQEVAAASADNTKKNERDTDPNKVTPIDQGETESDRTITQDIRQALVKDGELSMTAKNVKVITVDGVVTLRGPVKSDKERTDIALVAQKTTNVKRVDNQLEIAN